MASSSDVAGRITRYKLQLTHAKEASKILKTLKKLKDLEITLDVLAETGIGKTVNSLRRHDSVGELAKSLVRDWKKLVPKGSKSLSDDKTTEELPFKDKVKVVTEDLNNNYLTDERDEDETASKNMQNGQFDVCKDHRVANGLKKRKTGTTEFLNKTKVIEKEKKRHLGDHFRKESSDEGAFKSRASEDILGERKSKSHKRIKYNNCSSDESDFSDRDSCKKPLKETKPKDQARSESSRKKSKDRKSPIRLLGAQSKKRKKHDKHKSQEKSPVTKSKKTKRKEKHSTSETEEPAMSFESYLNYDENVVKKERPKPKKHPPKSKAVRKERTEKDANVQPEDSPKETMKCCPVRACPASPVKISTESVMKLPDSPPLESWFPEVDHKIKEEKEGNSCDVSEECAIFTGQRLNKKMQVYSGAKTIFLPAMMSLHQQCIRTLQNNINLLYETGGVPFEILEPVLQRCRPEQLLRIEEYNPIYIGETDQLWGKHCQRDFKDAKLLEYESWKEMYLRLSEERERKFKMLTKTISSAQSIKPKGRQVKMAFIHSVAKPPRDVRIKQEIHGTAVQQPLPKCSVKVQESRPRQIPKESSRPSSTTSTSTSSQDPRKKMKVAPMMAKSLKTFKKQFGRR